jgi:hypothetical protein
MFYRTRVQDLATGFGEDESSELSNGVFASHTFNETFSASARVQRTGTERNEESTVDLNYSASLRADYMSTFNQILSYAATQTEVDAGTGTNQSLFLRSNLQLYRGWSAYVDTGYAVDEPVFSTRTDSTTVRIGSNVSPHRTVTVNLDYQWRHVQTEQPESSRLTDADYNLQVFYVPFPALSFFGKYTLRDRQDRTTTLQNYSVNWSPFPDGALQCALNYNETLEPEADRISRNFGPFVKWRISRYLSLEAQYSYFIGESTTQDVDTQSLQGRLTLIW